MSRDCAGGHAEVIAAWDSINSGWIWQVIHGKVVTRWQGEEDLLDVDIKRFAARANLEFIVVIFATGTFAIGPEHILYLFQGILFFYPSFYLLCYSTTRGWAGLFAVGPEHV